MGEGRFGQQQRISESEREKALNTLKEFLRDDERIIFAYLFGSFNEGNTFRDIDIGVYTVSPDKDIEAEIELKRVLTEKTDYPVDISVINNAPPDVKIQVLEGTILICKDKELMTDFIEDAGTQYIEYYHLREIADEAIREAIYAKP
jgi:predicted nucleotidyltransferase